jgi:hypothetical protein
MKHLNISDIISSHEKRTEKRKESFKKVLELCYKRIEKCSQQDNIGCFFDVPEFLIGLPLFSINECIIFVYNHLISSGFTVQYIFPRILYISWLTPQYVHQVKQLTSLSPQARLLPPTAKGQKVKHVQSFEPPTINAQPTHTLPTKASPQRKKMPKKPLNPPEGKSIAEFKANGRCILNLT